MLLKKKKISKYIVDDEGISSHSDEENMLGKIQGKRILIMKKALVKKFWKKFNQRKILMK